MPGPRPLPEILAPGGDPDAVRAAILAGADAVYLGLGRFNARMRATNLAAGELRPLCRLARSHGVRVYVTVNTIVAEAELADALAVAHAALAAGADALILQDLGLLRRLREETPAAELHASTQLTTHDQAQLEVLARAGVSQVNLSRELSLGEIRALVPRAHDLGLRVEVFVHGAYCVSFSGQCYLSGLMTGLSGNRGECVQPCRRAYACGDEAARSYPLNLKDNNAIAAAGALVDAGVDALKIEGRRKGFHYVHTVVAAWRARLDALGRGEAAAGDDPTLGRVFNRGFSVAYLRGAIDRDAFALDGNDRSLRHLGVVAGYTADTRTLRCEGAPLAVGVRAGLYGRADGGGEGAGEYVGRFVVEAVLGPGCYRVRLEHELKGRIARGQRVCALAEQADADAVLARARALEVRRAPLDVAVAGAAGSPLVTVWKAGGATATVASAIALQPAARSALDRAQLERHLGKLGETDFALRAVDSTDLAADLFLPVSELNRLRQAAVERLTPAHAPAARSPRPHPTPTRLAAPFSQRLLFVTDDLGLARELRGLVGPGAFVALELQGPDDHPAASPGDAPLEEWLAPLFPAIAFDADLPGYAATLSSRPWRLCLSENAGLGARAAAAGVPWIAGGLLNTANAAALSSLAACAGAAGAVVSPELSAAQVGALGAAATGTGLLRLVTIFGPLLALQTRQCLVRDFKRCRLPAIDATCVPSCRAGGPFALEDGSRFHALKRPGFHSQLWDARLLLCPEAIAAVGHAVDAFVVDLRDPGFVGRAPAPTLELARSFRDAVAAGGLAGAARAELRRLVGTAFRGPLGRGDRPAPPAPRARRGN